MKIPAGQQAISGLLKIKFDRLLFERRIVFSYKKFSYKKFTL